MTLGRPTPRPRSHKSTTLIFRPSPLALMVAGIGPGVIPFGLVSCPFEVVLAMALLVAVLAMLVARWACSISIIGGQVSGPSNVPGRLRSKIPVSQLTLGPGPDSGSPSYCLASITGQDSIKVVYLSKRNRARLLAAVTELLRQESRGS